MRYFLGVDTSNYRTSAAVCDLDGNVVKQVRRLLPVKSGELGLRQSEALFEHTKALPSIMEELGSFDIEAVGYSARPRDVQGSYMPCFLAGESVARGIAAVNGVRAYDFSHQAGHVKAAAYSCKDVRLSNGASFWEMTERDGRFITFHLSGGTTEALLYENGNLTIIGQTLDLNAGQAIDRVGVRLGLSFPSGPELEQLAEGMPYSKGLKISVKGADCNLAGVENMAMKRISDGEDPRAVAAFTLDFVLKTVDKMTENILSEHGDMPVLYAGGVTACKRIADALTKKYECAFAAPEFSGDNAAGIALLCRARHLGL